MSSPFHPGELRLQRHAGVEEALARFGRRAIRRAMPAQRQRFFAQLPFVVVGAVDPGGAPWASFLTGPPGFAHARDAQTLVLDAVPDVLDRGSLEVGSPVGLLGIELHSRRRNRLNGRVVSHDGGLVVRVEQSFGNCPQYIHPRVVEPGVAEPVHAAEHEALTAADRAFIARSDTFFVATSATHGSGERSVDASHRGGPPGFVHVNADGELVIPDYAGNNAFNTLGNIVSDGRAALAFVDFATGDLLQLEGPARVLLDDPRIAAFDEARRLWTVRPRRVLARRGGLPLRLRSP